MSFESYLESKNIYELDRMRVLKLASVWLAWLEKEGIKAQNSSYKNLMDYVGYLQELQKGVHHINKSLQVISHYYRYKNLADIACNLRIRGVQKATLILFKPEQIEAIYHHFEAKKGKGYYYKSDKIILGFIIYQALDMRDFMVLERHHLDLEKGQIYVPSKKQKLARIIPLQSHQILSLQEYITHHRNDTSDRLFAPQCEDYARLHEQFKRLSRRGKAQSSEKLDIEVLKLGQLRQSRIADWVARYGLRQAQYYAGFRQIISAERYRKLNLQDLQLQISLHHPLQ